MGRVMFLLLASLPGKITEKCWSIVINSCLPAISSSLPEELKMNPENCVSYSLYNTNSFMCFKKNLWYIITKTPGFLERGTFSQPRLLPKSSTVSHHHQQGLPSLQRSATVRKALAWETWERVSFSRSLGGSEALWRSILKETSV